MAGLTPEQFARQQANFEELVLRTLRATQSPTEQELPDGSTLLTGRMIGEAAIEAQEFASNMRAEENRRWTDVCRQYPYGVDFVDPAEFFWRPKYKAAIPIHQKYEAEFQDWLKEEFGTRDADFYCEICSPGVTWVRFVHEQDLTKYLTRFRSELVAFQARVHGPNQESQGIGG